MPGPTGMFGPTREPLALGCDRSSTRANKARASAAPGGRSGDRRSVAYVPGPAHGGARPASSRDSASAAKIARIERRHDKGPVDGTFVRGSAAPSGPRLNSGRLGYREQCVAQHQLQAPQGWVTIPDHHAALWADTLAVERRPLPVYEEVATPATRIGSSGSCSSWLIHAF